MINLLLTLIGLIFLVGIDGTYITLNKKFYDPILDPSVSISIVYAIATWLLIIVSIQLIVLTQKDLTNSTAFINGAILGLAMYGVYNLTSASLYPNKWTNTIIVGDTAWGMTITGFMSFILFYMQSNSTIFK